MIEEIDVIKTFLLFYDQNKRNEMGYDDFANMILSTNPTSKRVMRSYCNNNAHYYSKSDLIYSNANDKGSDNEANMLLMKCIGKELQLAKEVLAMIEEIKKQYDYNCDHLFAAVSDNNTLLITKESLGRFLNRMNCIYDQSDIESILHRLDINRDSMVNYNDFSTLFSFSFCRQHNNNSSVNTSLHSSKLYESKTIVKQLSPCLILRKAPSNYCHCGLDNNYDEYSQYNENIEEKFIEYFKLLIAKEKDIEKAKIDLMIRPDFNIDDAFRLFNSNNKDKAFLFISDIELFLEKISNNRLNQYELKLINKRFDFRHKGYISYADFFDFLVPFGADYRKILEERSRNRSQDIGIGIGIDNEEGSMLRSCFSEGTRLLLLKLVSIILEAEKLINGFRNQLKNYKKYVIDLFRSICKKDIEQFTIDELIEFLKRKGVLSTEMEMSLLYIRLDRNRTGQIELFELDDEFTYLF